MKEYSKTLLILAQTLVEKTGTLYHNGKTKKMQSSIGSRAGQNFQGLNFQTPPRKLAQIMNAYQVWGP